MIRKTTEAANTVDDAQDRQQRSRAPEHRAEHERHGPAHGAKPGEDGQRICSRQAGRLLRDKRAVVVLRLVIARARGQVRFRVPTHGSRVAACLPQPFRGGELLGRGASETQRVKVTERPGS